VSAVADVVFVILIRLPSISSAFPLVLYSRIYVLFLLVEATTDFLLASTARKQLEYCPWVVAFRLYQEPFLITAKTDLFRLGIRWKF